MASIRAFQKRPQQTPVASPIAVSNEPRFSSWMPGRDDLPSLRYWVAPRIGDIVQTKFPDYLRDEFSIRSCVKIRPCMVVGVEEFASGQVIVKVAYGSSQVADHESSLHSDLYVAGLRPGDMLVCASDKKTGLLSDTKFSLRKVITLPFSTEHFSPFENGKFGVYPKRGRVDLQDPQYRRALDVAIADYQRLGSALMQTGNTAHLVRHSSSCLHTR